MELTHSWFSRLHLGRRAPKTPKVPSPKQVPHIAVTSPYLSPSSSRTDKDWNILRILKVNQPYFLEAQGNLQGQLSHIIVVMTCTLPGCYHEYLLCFTSIFILQGIPGMEDKQRWISTLFFSMYFLIILRNCTIHFTISSECSLHKSMLLFLCMLARMDRGMPTTTIPKMLCIFWFNLRKINYEGCLVNLFFIHSISALQSANLITMVVDLYVVIWEPLCYYILSNSLIGLIGLVSLVIAMLSTLPMLILLQQVPFHANCFIPTVYGEHMVVVKMVCVDTTINGTHGLVLALLVVGLNISGIASFYVLIIWAIMWLSSKESHHKAVNTYTTHICVMLSSYTPESR
ncbi:LOW QUALITY PROTEIN: olfactory receptor 52K1-like [Rhynchonycteris naso]